MSEFSRQGHTYTNGEFIIDLSILVGSGSLGNIYPCTKIMTKETLCAKISFQRDDSKYLKEIRMINTLREAYLNNQNLVKVYLCQCQTDGDGKVLIIIMENCATNLQDELHRRKGNFTSEEVINILKQLLNGYLPLYENSIIHRHIKPSRILISYDFQGKPIYKLSCSKIYIGGKKIDDGTPMFEAPELNYLVTDTDLDQELLQLKKIPNGKSQVDVYSIGIMLYHFLVPFQSRYSFLDFLWNLKVHPFKIQDKSQNINSDLQEMIEGMIAYNPMARITFFEIYSSKLISIQTQQPAKLFRQTINPESKPNKFNQSQGGQKPLYPFSPIPNVNSNLNPNLRATNPSPNADPFYRFTTYIPTNSDNIQQHSFQQSTTIQQQTQFSQTNQIQIDEYNDPQNYLKAQLSENSLLYRKDTEMLLRQALESIQQFNQEKINTNLVKLMKYFKYEENGSYSLGFLKFYYCLIIRANKQIIKKQFNSEQELQQEIANILKMNDHNVY